MTREGNREYQRRKDEAYRRQMEEQRRQKKRIQVLWYLGSTILFCFCTYMIGKKAGEDELRAKLNIAVMGEEVLESQSDTSYESYTGGKDGILLVNKNNPLPDDYEVELVTLQDGKNRAAKEAYEPLNDMLKAGRKEGLEFEICSSYRDVERQTELFEEDLETLIRQGYSYQEAYDEVAKETMPPGCSEHSTGLAFDIVALDYQMLDEGQERTAENKWLQEHCAEYGFILRYPEDKEDITLINYESWHFRYVGVEAAQYIMEEGITLEEYLEMEDI